MTSNLDLNTLLSISPEIVAEDTAYWAAVGRAIHQRLSSKEFLEEVRAAHLWDSHAPNLTRRLRLFLTKGLLP